MLSERRVFLAIGGILLTLGLASFLAVGILRFLTGHTLDVYYTPRLGPVPFVVGIATILAILVVVIVVGVLRLIQWYRQRAVTPNNRWRGP
jgi:hypothetical protein